jgi:hypothetical protein
MAEKTMRIYKYALTMTDYQTIKMPEGARILTCAAQGSTVCLWALVDVDASPGDRIFVMYGTGHIANTALTQTYVGTALLPSLGLVLHVFEEVVNG